MEYILKNSWMFNKLLMITALQVIYFIIIYFDMIDDYDSYVIFTNLFIIVMINFIYNFMNVTKMTLYNKKYDKFLINRKKNIYFKNIAVLFIEIIMSTICLIAFFYFSKITFYQLSLILMYLIILSIYIYVLFIYVLNYLPIKKKYFFGYISILMLVLPVYVENYINKYRMLVIDNLQLIFLIFLIITFLMMLISSFKATKKYNKNLRNYEKIEIKNLNIISELDSLVTVENLSIDSGTYLLKGRNGVGKTTFLNILAGNQLHENIKYDFELCNITSSVIYFAHDQKDLYNITELQLFNKLSFINNKRYETKYSSEFKNKKLTSYSTGEFKLALMKIIMILDPKVLILDEPFESLDNNNNLLLYKFIEQRNKNGRITIITTHLNEYIAKFENVLHMDNKTILVCNRLEQNE